MHSLELCAGAGGQALGLERAGFNHVNLVEIEASACATLRANRPEWQVTEGDLTQFSALSFRGVDLVAGGVPCPPFSKAGKQLGTNDERNLFPEAIRVVDEARPNAMILENVRGLLDPIFAEYRESLSTQLAALGYWSGWHLLNSADFGVSQSRPRVVFVALKRDLVAQFSWPVPVMRLPPTVGELLRDLMMENGWKGAQIWAKRANAIAPTLVGGSKKHGGPDLGPTRARAAWQTLGVDGRGLVDAAPAPDFVGMPRLTVRMCARVQGFPDDWKFVGKKTPAYRQVGNAFPPPVAMAVGTAVADALNTKARAKFRATSLVAA
jgi:DNA (cytosine-5)-methyltransferase 1